METTRPELTTPAAPIWSAYAPASTPATASPPECLLVVDIGHSHSTATPLLHGRPLHPACRRLDVGGRTLTNRLRDVLSRTVVVQHEDWLVQEIKEDVCYVSSDFAADLTRAWRGGQRDPRPRDPSIVVDYVLPDYETTLRGFARPPGVPSSTATPAAPRREHVISLANERFTVPELLFTPSDVGMPQDGLAGTVLQSVHALPPAARPAFLANILVVGGGARLPGLLPRLHAELRPRVDEELPVRLALAHDPVRHAWRGGLRVARDPDARRAVVVSREEYWEHGEGWTRRRFAGMAGR